MFRVSARSVAQATKPDSEVKSPPQQNPKSEKIAPAASLLGGAAAGATLEFFVQPLDVTAKRLQTNKTVITSWEQANKIIFKDMHSGTTLRKLASLYDAIWLSVGYSVVQRTYKFGGQPIAVELGEKYAAPYLAKHFDEPTQKTIIHAGAGAAIGGGEAALSFLDNLKVKRQNKTFGPGWRPIVQVIKTERWALYNGWEAVVFRNVPGSLTLFGGRAYVIHHGFGLKHHSEATYWQNFCAAAVGAAACVVVTNPADVIKVRTQNILGHGHVSAFSMFKSTLKNEGVRAFGKGLVPRATVAIPKLIAVQMLANGFASFFHRKFFATAEVPTPRITETKSHKR